VDISDKFLAMVSQIFLPYSLRLSRSLSMLSSTSPSSWTQSTSPSPRREGFLAIPVSIIIKDHCNNIFNIIKDHRHNIFNIGNYKHHERLLDSPLSRKSVLFYSSDTSTDGKDLSKLKEDWEEEGVTCEHCKIGFSSEEKLRKHITSTGMGGKNGCKVLWRKKNKADVNAGILTHICDICEIGFKWKSQLDAHKSIHSEARPFVCSECGNSYKLQMTLNKHVREKHSGQVFECPECETTFNNKSQMKRHLKVCRREEKEFKCSQCGSKFHTNWELTTHIKHVHTKERPYKCELCEERFAIKGNLKQHVLAVHENARPHQCEECSAAFSTAGGLKNHRIRHHTFDWPHICHVCEERGIKKGYIAIGGLEKHMKAQHPVEYQEQMEREKPAVCHVCEKRFKNEMQVSIHIKKKHKKV